MDSIVALLIICLLTANLIAVIFLIKRKQPDQIDNSQIFKDEVSIQKSMGKYIQFNFASPKNLAGFISENKTLWKNYFSKNMSKMGMVNWGVGRKIAPTGMNTSSVSTWDMFDSLENLMKYRVGFELPSDVAKKSKMGSYNPDGWKYSPIFNVITFAASAQ